MRSVFEFKHDPKIIRVIKPLRFCGGTKASSSIRVPVCFG